MKFDTGKKSAMAGIAAASFALGITFPVHAQTGQQPQAAAPTSQAMSRDMRASQLIGKQVENPKGESLGKIEDLIIDANGERVYYALMSSGGVAGVGGKQFLFPVSRFSMGRDADQLVLNIDKNSLRKAPGFDPGQRPASSSNTFYANVDRFYKIKGDRQLPKDARMTGASDLIGSNINDHGQRDIGEIADVVVNFGNGRAYVVLDAGKNKLVALPFGALTIPSRPGVPIQANVDRPKIETARGFDKDQWAHLNSPGQQQQINNQLMSFQVQSKPNPAATQSGRETASGSSR